ncbi:MAG: hypothetical protein ABJA94_08140 [Rhodoglobus sp.]
MAIWPAIACGAIAIAVLVFVGNDASRWASASGFGVLALIAAAISLQWVVEVLTAAQGAIPGDYRLGQPSLIYFAAVAWGGVTFLLALVGGRGSLRPVASDGKSAARARLGRNFWQHFGNT